MGQVHVTGSANNSARASNISVEKDRRPIAKPGGPYAGEIGKAITFNGAQSSDIVSYKWDFGDDKTSAPDTEATADHVYTKKGVYNISLTVTDNKGGTDSATTTVTVEQKNCWEKLSYTQKKAWGGALAALVVTAPLMGILGGIGAFNKHHGGAACTYNIQCASGECKDTVCKCAIKIPCINNLWCEHESKKCLPPHTEYGGDPCRQNVECKSDYCIFKHDTAEGECGCTDNTHCRPRHYCNGDSMCVKRTSPIPTEAPTPTPTISTVVGLYEIEVYPPPNTTVLREFSNTDLVRFADVAARVSHEYGAEDKLYNERRTDDICTAHIESIVPPTLATKCTVKKQQKLSSDKSVRIIFLLKWTSPHVTPDVQAFPHHANRDNRRRIKDLLYNGGFGFSTYNERKVVEVEKVNVHSDNLGEEVACNPDTTNSAAPPIMPGERGNHTLSVPYSQQVALGAANVSKRKLGSTVSASARKFSKLELKIIEEDFLASFDPVLYNSLAIWAQTKCNITNQTLVNRPSGATITLTYIMTWAFREPLTTDFEVEAKKFEVYVNSLPSTVLAKKMNSAGLRSVLGVGNATLDGSPIYISPPTESPTAPPTHQPSQSPSRAPTQTPTVPPSPSPTNLLTTSPSASPTHLPTASPSSVPTKAPTSAPTIPPSALPTPRPYEARLIFVTSNAYRPGIDFTSLDEADGICEQIANEEKLGRWFSGFKAWISDSNRSPASDFTEYGYFVQTDGGYSMYASSWEDLVSKGKECGNGPYYPIEFTEKGKRVSDTNGSAMVWTGTHRSLTVSGTTCSDWTSKGDPDADLSTDPGKYGTATWTNLGICDAMSLPCVEEAHLYCFEQIPLY